MKLLPIHQVAKAYPYVLDEEASRSVLAGPYLRMIGRNAWTRATTPRIIVAFISPASTRVVVDATMHSSMLGSQSSISSIG